MEGEPPSESEPASNRYGTVSYRDCPELFPFYVEQFHKMIQSYPSIYSGYMEYYISEFCEKVERVHLQHLLVMVDYTTLQVVAGISFMLLPGSATLYVEYMLTAPEHRGKGFMKTLFGAMKDQALTTCPDQYKGGFNAIITETRACPTQAKGDYFSDWRGVENTHRALNKIGFYQACFNYIMPGNIQADGKLEEFSEDYVFLVHKDSKALFPSAQTGFVLELDSFYIESFILTCLREIQPYSKNTLEFGADLVKALSVVPLNSCPIRRTVPFYRTDKTYHSDYGWLDVFGAVPRFHDMPISRSSCGPLGKAPELEIDMMQELTISRARALLKKSRQYAEKLRRESEGEGEVTRVRADSDGSSSTGSRSRTASDDTGYRSCSPADTADTLLTIDNTLYTECALLADAPPAPDPLGEPHDKKNESPVHNDEGTDPPLSSDTHEPGRPDRTPKAITERLKL